jgi:hypothetical protein
LLTAALAALAVALLVVYQAAPIIPVEQELLIKVMPAAVQFLLTKQLAAVVALDKLVPLQVALLPELAAMVWLLLSQVLL